MDREGNPNLCPKCLLQTAGVAPLAASGTAGFVAVGEKEPNSIEKQRTVANQAAACMLPLFGQLISISFAELCDLREAAGGDRVVQLSSLFEGSGSPPIWRRIVSRESLRRGR